MAVANTEDRYFWISNVHYLENRAYHTLLSTILWIKTRLHATANVSIEFEKVWVWMMQPALQPHAGVEAIVPIREEPSPPTQNSGQTSRPVESRRLRSVPSQEEHRQTINRP
ncbi:hypothetical protein HYALB_00009484 [Hymenoscyphus albidus]|uniref:Uncharacterized protein n=1 Tax=Hymenoscyphus albidus TaxID=595503 RepID=A0A9N9LUQ8_9HELO|nr:hypothetical protein HYALB_00009484 [Hymenoscyphus albidus]